MEQWVQFITLAGLFLWNIKRTDDLRKDLTEEIKAIKENHLVHIYQELCKLNGKEVQE